MSDESDFSDASMDNETTPACFPTLEEIALLLPQYEFHGILGVGGMGAVYLARQPALDRWVAIKLLPATASQNEEDASRFIAEARSMAKLTHAHIAAVHDFGQTMQGQLYLVMEYVTGQSLHQLIHGDDELPQAQIRSLITQLCDALSYAHGHHVVHRDIKPANILITTDWQAKIIDFGLAQDKNAETGGEAEYGTPDYLAPERLQLDAKVDHRADIYSLGVVIHEMFTKLTPQAAGAATGKGMPAVYASVVSRCTAADPARRFQRCEEIKSFLNAAANVAVAAPAANAPAHRPLPPNLQARVRQAPGPRPVYQKQPSGTPWWIWAAACAAVLAGAGWLIQNQRGPGNDTADSSAAQPASDPTTAKIDAPVEPAPVITDAPPGPFKPDAGGLSIVKRLKGHKEAVHANAILADQRHAVSGGNDDLLKLWDVATGAELKSFPSPVGDINGLQAASDGKRVLLYSWRTDQAAIFDIEEGKAIATIKGPTNRLWSATWSEDQKTVYLLCNDADGGVYHWDPAKPGVLQQLSEWTRAASQVFPLPADSPSGTSQLLVIGSTLKPNPNPSTSANQPLVNDKAWASLFSVPDHRHIRDLPAYTNIRNRLSLSPDGTTLMGGLGALYVLDVPQLTTRFSMNAASTGMCSSSAWAGAGRLMVAAYADGSLVLLEAETGSLLDGMKTGLRVNSLSLSQDESWMLACGFPLDVAHPKPEDFEVLVIRLPDLGNMGSDKGFLSLATRQLPKLGKLDPELAALHAKHSGLESDPQLRDLTVKYGAALKRTAATATPQDQLAMNAEADSIAQGKPVPDATTDDTTSGDHKRLRGIYRDQVAQLQSRRAESGNMVSEALATGVKSLASQRRQAGDRLGSARCDALLISLTAAPPPAPVVAATMPKSTVPPNPPIPPPAATPPPTAPALPSIAAPKLSFANEVKVDVAIGRPSKIKGGDFDDKMQVIEPRVKMTNTSLKQAYEGYKAAFLLIGESAVDIKVIQVLQREEFPLSIPARLFVENKLPSVTTQYDTTGAKFGFKYEGWVVQVTGPNGEVVYTKSTFPSIEKLPEQVQQLKAGMCYDRKLKVVPEPELRF